MTLRRIVLLVAVAVCVPAVPAGDAALTPRCRAKDLLPSFVAGSPGAGQRYATLRLTNIGPFPCHVRGYPGAQLRRRGVAVPTEIVRDPGPVATVTLLRGDRAFSQWHWTVVPSGDERIAGPCAPIPDHVRVTPPDAVRSVRARWRFGTVCDHGRIDVAPMRGA